MFDWQINIGYVDNDIIAICDDHDHSYAFHATVREDKWQVRVESTHGAKTAYTYDLKTGHRSMIMKAMGEHLDFIAKEIASERRFIMETDKSLN